MFIFRFSLNKVDSQFLHDQVFEVLQTISLEQIKASRLDIAYISELSSRLDIYKIQKRTDMLLALLWEVYFALDKMNKLVAIMNKIRSQSGP